MVHVELLLVPGCSNEAPAAALLRSALAQAGLPDQGFQVIVMGDEQEAAAWGFTGSPTFLLNGADPFRDVAQPTGLTCRLYRGGTGSLSGLPSLMELRDAVTRAAQEAADQVGARHG